ncbi:MAG TPA: 50S ribosomal protein L5 [Phycisphaerae bacterium]|nr:50S ribosomal protein L5 [Phycisphaerae bacterium]
MSRLKEKYKKEIMPAFVADGIANPMSIPAVKKVVISMGLGQHSTDKARYEACAEQLAKLSGQKPIITKARKSVSNFKVRAGMNAGMKVTLRRERMYEFLDRLISLAIPRVKDFRGLNPSGFDGQGNYNMGLSEQSVFPEIDPAAMTFTQGMNISIETSAENDEQARKLLKLMGMPFRD